MLFQKIAVFSETGELLSDCDIRVENGTISEISKTPLGRKFSFAGLAEHPHFPL